jgi:DNA-binding NarL/FixJ family response regulator
MNKVILGDDQAIFRAGIAKVLASEQFVVAAQCSSMAQMMSTVEANRFSTVVFASSLRPNMPVFMSRVKAAGSQAVVIAESGEFVSAYTVHGVRGLVYRDTTDAALVTCVQKVMRGLTCVSTAPDAACSEDRETVGARVRDLLTQKEMEIVALLMQGCKNREIAQRLGNSEQVVKNHLRSIYRKAGVSDRLEFAVFAIQQPIFADAVGKTADNMRSVICKIASGGRLQMHPA